MARMRRTDIGNCKYCGSPVLIKAGLGKWDDGTVQRHRCLSCGRRFKDDLAPYHMRYPLPIIDFALELREKGLPYRLIISAISSRYNRKPSLQTVNAWVKNSTIRDFISRAEGVVSC